MRIVSGKHKGKILLAPKTDNVRPTADKVKQAIFTKLQFNVANSRVLDLFAGSGALGIEAISRYAKEVVFVDHDAGSVALTKKNLALINEKAKVLKMTYADALLSFNEPFDLILIDPPYKSGVYEECLKLIYERNLLTQNGIIVCEHSFDVDIKNEYFCHTDSKKYGTVKVEYYELN